MENRNAVANGYARELIRVGQVEIEVEGPPDYVERRIEDHYRRIEGQSTIPGTVRSESPQSIILPGFDSEEPILFPAQSIEGATLASTHDHTDVCALVRQKSPRSKYHTTLVIIYHRQVNQGLQDMSYEDLSSAYEELLRLGVDEPGNPRQHVAQGVEDKYIYKPRHAQGRFALTEQGVQFVEKMGTVN